MLSRKLAMLIALFPLLSNCSSLEGEEIDRSDAEQRCKAHIAAGIEIRSEDQCVADTFAANQMIRHTFPAAAAQQQENRGPDKPGRTVAVQFDRPPADASQTTWRLPAPPTAPAPTGGGCKATSSSQGISEIICP
jgi:hypothetical protein